MAGMFFGLWAKRGGGGFAMVYRPGNKAVALDFREIAPAAAGRDMCPDPTPCFGSCRFRSFSGQNTTESRTLLLMYVIELSAL